jgi:hypothetical protein
MGAAVMHTAQTRPLLLAAGAATAIGVVAALVLASRRRRRSAAAAFISDVEALSPAAIKENVTSARRLQKNATELVPIAIKLARNPLVRALVVYAVRKAMTKKRG